METLRRVEKKLDDLKVRERTQTPIPGGPSNVGQSSQSSARTPDSVPFQSQSNRQPSDLDDFNGGIIQMRQTLARHIIPRHIRTPHLVFMWPRNYSDLLSSQTSIVQDLDSILHEGVSWFAKKEASKHKTGLSIGEGFSATTFESSDRALAPEANLINSLNPVQIREISDAYFHTFNLIYPILDRDHFVNTILNALLRESCSPGNANGIILLLVLALGQVSIDGNSGAPISMINNQPSGFRGGSLQEPPGLAEFNEARRGLGFLATDCTIEYAQIMLLQSMYCESHARHIDYWRCVTLASSAVQGLQKLHSVDWTTFYGDQLKRAFWTCVVQEDFFHIALDLPETGINQGGYVVPLPHFRKEQEYTEGPEQSELWIFHAQFLALIALRGIICRINDVMCSSEGPLHLSSNYDLPLRLTLTISVRTGICAIQQAICNSYNCGSGIRSST